MQGGHDSAVDLIDGVHREWGASWAPCGRTGAGVEAGIVLGAFDLTPDERTVAQVELLVRAVAVGESERSIVEAAQHVCGGGAIIGCSDVDAAQRPASHADGVAEIESAVGARPSRRMEECCLSDVDSSGLCPRRREFERDLVAVIVLLLGYWRANTLLMGLATVFLLFFLSAYYYNLEITLLNKSYILLGTGAVLLVVRLLFHRLIGERDMMVDE